LFRIFNPKTLLYNPVTPLALQGGIVFTAAMDSFAPNGAHVMQSPEIIEATLAEQFEKVLESQC
jgi:hypothetical protein